MFCPYYAQNDPQNPRKTSPWKKALLIGIQYATSGSKPLIGPHKDVLDMKRVLMERYGYEERNITMLMDNGDPKIEPTRRNIMIKIKELVAGAQAGDHFFFHYAGHGMQMENKDNSEEDGKDEYLDHYRCNRVYTPWISKGKRRSASKWNHNVRRYAELILSNARSNPCSPVEAKEGARRAFRAGLFSSGNVQPRRNSIEQMLSRATNQPVTAASSPPLSISTNVERVSFILSPERHVKTPEPLWPCDGFCRDELVAPDGRVVISLSSSKDEQKSYEDGNGASMTQEDPNPSFHKLLKRISHDLHRSYLRRHDEARAYKEKWRIRAEKAMRCNQPVRERMEVEMDNFQDPQVGMTMPITASARILIHLHFCSPLTMMNEYAAVVLDLHQNFRRAQLPARFCDKWGFLLFPRSHTLCAPRGLEPRENDVPSEGDMPPTGPRKRKRALLIGINYSKLPRGKGRLFKPQDDVAVMRKLLIEVYDYKPDDIVIMTDHEETPEFLEPTKDNITRQMINLVMKPEEGDEFFFYYAGHAIQREEKERNSERDHKDEYILPLDAIDEEGQADLNFAIEDGELKEALVQPLLDAQVRCQMIAVMDACTSGTLLDLEHDLCNQVIGWKSRLLETPPEARSRIRARVASWLHDKDFECNGMCNRKATSQTKVNVICISACEDSQELMEMISGHTLAGLLDIYLRSTSPSHLGIWSVSDPPLLARNKRPSLKELNRFMYDEFKNIHKTVWKSYKEERKKHRKKKRSEAPRTPPKEWDKPQRMDTLLKL
ncbi:hypothetical protein D9756_006837 [Leucocoprinus leucothites]|uniref:Peptidase C14 caspase domain-containing protein n=1 Tax=Leucocoprinus leucothites TaxID=201217 RepID=A0A8H5G212_9AGAR|nr:hypothetical protein D9756_006837 [Leucoagaricus leucothites]